MQLSSTCVAHPQETREVALERLMRRHSKVGLSAACASDTGH